VRSTDVSGRPTRNSGLAAVFHHSIPVHVHQHASKIEPTTFELQLLRIGASSSPVTVIHVYRPQWMSTISSFINHFADIIALLTSECSDNTVVTWTARGQMTRPMTRAKLLSLTYKVLTTTQPPYLHKLISTQRPRSTRSSSVVTLARPPSSSSLKITDRSFRYASPCLWNQLPLSLRKPHSDTSSSISYSPVPSPITSSFSDSPLCTSITPSLFHSRLKTYRFHKSYPP